MQLELHVLLALQLAPVAQLVLLGWLQAPVQLVLGLPVLQALHLVEEMLVQARCSILLLVG